MTDAQDTTDQTDVTTAPAAYTPPEPTTATVTLPRNEGDEFDLPEGTPVIAGTEGRVGTVLSYDPITGQAQVELAGGGRGWFRRVEPNPAG